MKDLDPPAEWQDNLVEVIEFIQAATKDRTKWVWFKNSRCKYISLKFDMRDGAFIILDRDSKRITLEELKEQ
jgi:hypothetical protein